MLLGGVGHSEDALIFGAWVPGIFGFRSCILTRCKNWEPCNKCGVENSPVQGRVLLSLSNFIWETVSRLQVISLLVVQFNCTSSPLPWAEKKTRHIF